MNILLTEREVERRHGNERGRKRDESPVGQSVSKFLVFYGQKVSRCVFQMKKPTRNIFLSPGQVFFSRFPPLPSKRYRIT